AIGLPLSGLLLASDGNFYGCSQGSVFKMTLGGVLTTLVSLIPLDGLHPEAALTLGPDRNFYGTTFSGGPNDFGTLFRFSTNGTFASIASFNGTNGANPKCQLAMDTNGDFYGTATGGGSNLAGTVFRVTTNGVLTTLVSFSITNGNFPGDGLIVG